MLWERECAGCDDCGGKGVGMQENLVRFFGKLPCLCSMGCKRQGCGMSALVWFQKDVDVTGRGNVVAQYCCSSGVLGMPRQGGLQDHQSNQDLGKTENWRCRGEGVLVKWGHQSVRYRIVGAVGLQDLLGQGRVDMLR